MAKATNSSFWDDEKPKKGARPSGVDEADLDAAHLKGTTGYQFGRRGQAVSEFTLKDIVTRKDAETLGEIELLQARFKSLLGNDFKMMSHVHHTLGMFLSMLVLVGALLVDYRIIHEFWTRVAMDDSGRIAASLKLSVYFKSAQVVFATLAFHFMLDTLSERARNTFIRCVFTLTTIMLVGIGFIVALKWLPPGSDLFGIIISKGSHSGNDILASLGLAPSNGETQAFSFKSIETVVWLISLSMIFIIVTSVGALSLQRSVHEFQILSGARVDDPDRTDGALQLKGDRAHRLEQLAVRAQRFGLSLGTEDDAPSENQFVERKKRVLHELYRFTAAYAAGLRDYQNAFFGVLSGVRARRTDDLERRLGVTINKILDFVGSYFEGRYEKTMEASAEEYGENVAPFKKREPGGH
jgi:hypothetical protein